MSNTNTTPAARASRHTPEPWRESIAPDDLPTRAFLVDTDNNFVAQFAYSNSGKQNCRRAVSCVNALAGLNPEAVAGVVEALNAVIKQWDSLKKTQRQTANGTSDMGRLVTQARAALAALRSPEAAL